LFGRWLVLSGGLEGDEMVGNPVGVSGDPNVAGVEIGVCGGLALNCFFVFITSS
jgi:hypothetical protein